MNQGSYRPGRRAALRLVPLDGAALRELTTDPEGWAARAGASLGAYAEVLRSVAEQTTTHHGGAEPPLPWAGYIAIDTSDDRAIGTCAFKSPPGADRAVEIAYFTFPDDEGRGYGGAMAAELIAIAAVDEAVTIVRAHTLPEVNASGSILTRLGFANLGTVIDPDDGPVWRWERPTRPQETR